MIDQNMPTMDGSKLAVLFRGNRALRHLGLVLVSGDDVAAMAGVARDAGADAFVCKASLAAELAGVVARLQKQAPIRVSAAQSGSWQR